jgi:hypothetical protein
MEANMLNEKTMRARAARQGYVLRKSRSRVSSDNHGEYMLIEAERNFVVLGARFNATLEDIQTYLG